MAEKALRRKKAFFDLLNAVEDHDEHLDEGLNASMRALSKACVSSVAGSLRSLSEIRPRNEMPVEPMSSEAVEPQRSIVQPNFTEQINEAGKTTPSASTEEVTVVKETPAPTTKSLPPAPRESDLVPYIRTPRSNTSVTSGKLTMTGKRKRSGTTQEIFGQRRIFQGLTFFFVPNNDIAGPRRMRIKKAIEYGATWTRDWRQGTTHVIVDNEFTINDVLKVLGLGVKPDAVIIVNETYPAACLSHRCLVDADQPYYQIKGLEAPKVHTTSEQPLSEASEKSLQLKPARKDDIVVEPETPSRTEESGSVDDVPHEEARPVFNLANNVGKEMARNHVDEYDDDLADMILVAKTTEHLPLDSEDEDLGYLNSSRSSNLGSSERENREGVSDRHTPGANAWQQKFSCMQSNDGNKQEDNPNPNAKTIEILQEIATYYDSTQDRWRTLAYRKVITTLRKQTLHITTKEEAERLPFIGARLAAKIEEIVWTNKLRRLENTKLEPDAHAFQTFLNVYGIGFQQASKFVQAGFKTLDDLLANANLTDNQRVGIAHYTDFLTRIPRAEVEKLGAVVERALHHIDAAIQITIGGSYRRGAKDSGDIDLIITKPGASTAYLKTIVVDTLVPRLAKQGFLTACLAATSKDTGTKWHGACQLPSQTLSHLNGHEESVPHRPWRRIDLLLVPWDEIGAAMIYFTGNDIFNRSIRLLARKKGMRLNQKGLYVDVMRDSAQGKVTEGNKVEGANERKIFERLGVPWREPWERIC